MAKHLVFISHSGADTWVARQISQHCRNSGAETFLDATHIEVGAEFEEEIRDALNAASEFVVLATPSAIEKPYVWMEIGAAWIRRIRIVAILYGISAEEFQAKSKVPVTLKKSNLIDINATDRYFEELRQRVAEIQQMIKAE